MLMPRYPYLGTAVSNIKRVYELTNNSGPIVQNGVDWDIHTFVKFDCGWSRARNFPSWYRCGEENRMASCRNPYDPISSPGS